MVTTTLAHVAENKIYRLLCMGGLALIQSICFANFTDNHYFVIFFMSMFLWTNMCYEDATTGLVDIRKILILGMSWMLCSYHIAGGFLVSYLNGLLVWIIFYFFMGIKANYLDDNGDIDEMTVNEHNNLKNTMDMRVPLLPFLLAGMMIMAIVITFFSEYFSGVLYKAQMGDMLYDEFGLPIILVLMIFVTIGVLANACSYRYLMNRKRNQGKIILKPGIGMGDIILFPLIMSFFGDIFSFGMIFISFITAGVYINYKTKQVKEKGDEA